jgi:hypothetical protein
LLSFVQLLLPNTALDEPGEVLVGHVALTPFLPAIAALNLVSMIT